MFSEGDPAPDIDLVDHNGDRFSLTDRRGRRVVLFFYPRDNTSGCTREATGFSAALASFAAADTDVVGISPDSSESHLRFRAKHDINLTLLSDPEHEAMNAYDVWRQKKLYGRTFLGVVRSTFLIDEHGRIGNIWRNVRVSGHVEKVLAAAQILAEK